MPQLIKMQDGRPRICEDRWQQVESQNGAPREIPPGAIIVPLGLWQEHRAKWLERGEVGVLLMSDESAQDLAGDCARLPLIAVDFPLLTDGRGFSTGRLLRERHGFRGELRAVGAFIRDQLFYLKRCGFDAFLLENQEKLEDALRHFEDFHTGYQGAADDPRPLFRNK